MRYINQLQDSVRDKTTVINDAYDDVTEILQYLAGSKFAEDNTVQIRTDIYPKLMALRSKLLS